MARDNRIDSIKGLLIILVILGHLIIALDNYNFINHCVMGFIYIFHMPLFILISGYVTKHPDNQQPRDMWKTVGNIMVTLIIFQFISSLRIYLYHGDVLTSLKGFPFGILWYLCEHRGQVVPSEELFEAVWGEKYLDNNNTVMAHIARLREKLNEPPRKPKFIKTVWGVGYRIDA